MEELGDLLRALEQRLLDPAVRKDAAAVGELLTEDFREFGSSGRVFDRTAILEMLAVEQVVDQAGVGPVASISEFNVTLVQPDVALVTYVATAAAQRTLRSSLWVRREAQWQMLFHQGTPQAEQSVQP